MSDLSKFLSAAVETLKPSDSPFLLAIVATDAEEQGPWIVRFPERAIGALEPGERPDATIIADTTTLVLLFSGQLIATKAIEQRIVRVEGTPDALERLAVILAFSAWSGAHRGS